MAAVRVQPREKIYYNINIVSNPMPGEFESTARFNVVLNQALIDDVSQYQFMLQKFKIDSESIPLFYVELLQPQIPVVNNTNFITIYYVYLVYNGDIYSTPLLYSAPWYGPAKITRRNDTVPPTVYYDNREELFAIYSYDIFISMINDAITLIYEQAGLVNPPFFQYNHLTEKIEYNKVDGPDMLYFSNNLHPYIGEAMNTIWYVVRPPLITTDVFSIQLETDTRLQTINDVGGVEYIKMIQEYKAISSWANINRILFVSHRLPIRREFYPVKIAVGC